jgi:hypothetical protein
MDSTVDLQATIFLKDTLVRRRFCLASAPPVVAD